MWYSDSYRNFVHGIQKQHTRFVNAETKRKKEEKKKLVEASIENSMKLKHSEEEFRKQAKKLVPSTYSFQSEKYQKLLKWASSVNDQIISERKKILAEKKERQKLLQLAEKNYKGWKPRIWSTNGKVFSVMYPLSPAKKFNVNFEVYVTNDKSFTSSFQKFDISYKPPENEKFVRKIKFDVDACSYFASLADAYVLANKCGFCREHMDESSNVPKIISCLGRYFLYFHMSRFLQRPSLLKQYLTYDEGYEVQKRIPVTKVWQRKFFDTKEIPILWWNEQKAKRREIRDVKAEHYANNNGQIGIIYHECVGENPVDVENDFMIFIPEKSLGLTSLGIKFFQEAIESFVYSVLGSQARTRWDIVGDGARSLQTQDVFKKLVRDTILETDTTKAISNMRKAIQDTNVVLNMAVSPGLILIPSDMIIVKEKTPGWNNVLTLATDKMLFGTNHEVNEKKMLAVSSKFAKKRVKRSLTDSSQTNSQINAQTPVNSSEFTKKKSTTENAGKYVVIGVVTSLLVKMIIYFV